MIKDYDIILKGNSSLTIQTSGGRKMTGPNRVSRVQLRDQDENTGSSYRDNHDGTIHVTHYEADIRESYDVPYGQDADNVGNSLGDSYHISSND